MADRDFIRHPASTAVRPPSAMEPELRAGWGSSGASERPARLMEHVQTEDSEAGLGALVGAMAAVALALIAAAVMVIAFAF